MTTIPLTLEEHRWQERKKLTPAMKRDVRFRDSSICQLCLEPIGDAPSHIDHKKPLNNWGKTILSNLQLTHSRCNLRKGKKLFAWREFMTLFTLYLRYDGNRLSPTELRTLQRPPTSPAIRVLSAPKPSHLFGSQEMYEQAVLPFGLDAYVGVQIPLGVH